MAAKRAREKLGPDFRERLKQLVEGHGGAAEVAHTGYPAISLVSLYAWMTGKKEPSLAKLGPLADTLGVSIDYLIRGTESEGAPTHSGQKVPLRVSAAGEDAILSFIISTVRGMQDWSRLPAEVRADLLADAYRKAGAETSTTRARQRVTRVLRSPSSSR